MGPPAPLTEPRCTVLIGRSFLLSEAESSLTSLLEDSPQALTRDWGETYRKPVTFQFLAHGTVAKDKKYVSGIRKHGL